MDKTNPDKSRDAANNAGNASVETGDTSGTGHAGDKTINRQTEHAPCAATEAWTTQHSAGTFAESTAAEAHANAAFYPAAETCSGG